ncbi:MAG: hypothetical protein CNLJKLNK_00898 [Holosporales bacterium]
MKTIIKGPENTTIHLVFNVKSKHMNLSFKQDHFRLSVPMGTKPLEIQRFIRRCESWMLKQIHTPKPVEVPQKSYKNGDKISVLGQEYTLIFTKDIHKKMFVKAETIEVSSPTSGHLFVLEAGLKDLIEKILKQRTLVYAKTLGKTVNNITIKDTKTRWGSCSSRQNINYCWRIVFAPSHVVDYLCAHEVAHLVEMNHSPRFWAIVKSLCPDYVECRKWLKNNGSKLVFHANN